VVHSPDLDHHCVGREIRTPSLVRLAVEHRVGAAGNAQRRVCRGGVRLTVGSEQHESVDLLWVSVRIATRHRTPEGVAADEPLLDSRPATDDLLGGVRVEHREPQRHLRDIHRDVRLGSERRERREIRVGVDAPARIEHEPSRRILSDGFERVHAVSVGEFYPLVGAHRLDRGVTTMEGRRDVPGARARADKG
jgi:hypothetical protein